MGDATPQPFGKGVLPLGVERKDATVNVASLVPELTTALATIGRLHLVLFDKPTVITSANDGKHAAESKHLANKAVDLMMTDKTDTQQALWIDVLFYLERRLRFKVRVNLQSPRSAPVHIETAG